MFGMSQDRFWPRHEVIQTVPAKKRETLTIKGIHYYVRTYDIVQTDRPNV
jgi:hypothetical protein